MNQLFPVLTSSAKFWKLSIQSRSQSQINNHICLCRTTAACLCFWPYKVQKLKPAAVWASFAPFWLWNRGPLVERYWRGHLLSRRALCVLYFHLAQIRRAAIYQLLVIFNWIAVANRFPLSLFSLSLVSIEINDLRDKRWACRQLKWLFALIASRFVLFFAIDKAKTTESVPDASERLCNTLFTVQNVNMENVVQKASCLFVVWWL